MQKMQHKIKHSLSLFLSLLIILTSIGSFGAQAYAAANGALPSSTVKSYGAVEGNLKDWILDEANGYIYAWSSNHDRLLFISTDDLKIKKEIELKGIKDVEFANGRLYVSRGYQKQIAVVDVKTATVEKSINTKETVYKIAVADNKLFYLASEWTGSSHPGFTDLHILDLKDLSETTINPGPESDKAKGYYFINLEADRENHVLYISSTNDSYSAIFSISTTDYKPLSSNSGDRLRGIYPYIIIQGDDVFFGEYRLDKNDLSRIYGSYGGLVGSAAGDYVFANVGERHFSYSLFDRESFIKKYEFPNSAYSRFLIDSKGILYLYEGQGWSVYKVPFKDITFDAPGDVPSNPGDSASDPGDGNPSLASLNYNADTAVPGGAVSRLSISKWLVDKERRLIYALSNENGTLMFIGLNDLKVKKSIVVGDDPVDLVLANGKLYVALSAINQVAVVDTETQAVKEKLILGYRPAEIAVDGNKLFYLGYVEKAKDDKSNKQNVRLYVSDLNSNIEKPVYGDNLIVSASSYFEFSLVLDSAGHMLYVGNPGGSGVIAVNTADLSVTGHADIYNQSQGVVSVSGDNLYFAASRLNPENLDTKYGGFPEFIIYASGNLAFSKKAVYDSETYAKIADLPFESGIVYVDDSKNVYLYEKDLKVIKKYSLQQAIDGFGDTYQAAVENMDYSFENSSSFDDGDKPTIDKMIVDDRNGLIYAISDGGFKLLVLNADDRKVKKEIPLGYETGDIKLYNGKLYVTSSTTGSIAIIDTSTLTVIRKIHVSGTPELVAVDAGKLFYYGFNSGLHVYDMNLNTETEFVFHDFKHDFDLYHVSGLFVDSGNHILYGVNQGATPRESYAAINTVDLKPVELPAKVGIANSVYFEGAPVFDGNDLFHGQTVYGRGDFSVLSSGLIGKILYVDDNIIITAYSVYLRSNYARLGDLPEYTGNLYVDGSKTAYSLIRLRSIKKTSIYEILDSLVNKTAEGESFNIDGYKPGGEYTVTDGADPVAGGDGAARQPDGTQQPGNTAVFEDITNHWAKGDIEYLAARGIVKGIEGASGNTFLPDDQITRAEFVTMVVRTLGVSGEASQSLMTGGGESSGEPEGQEFSDVSRGSWYYSSVMTATKSGLVYGIGNGRFAPDALITRQEIATLSTRVLEYIESGAGTDGTADATGTAGTVDTVNGAADIDDTLSTFKDKDSISDWARESAAAAVNAGIIKGMPGGFFAPASKSTRAEGATILKRILDRI